MTALRSPRLLFAALAILVAVVAAAPGLRALLPRSAPSVLLVTIDTLRADAIGSIGGGTHTPALDRLAAEGMLFDEAVSAAPTTGPSHASIFSGQFPYRHGIRNNGQAVTEQTPLLADVLQQAGYATAAFISGFPLHRMFGFDRGFEHYDDEFGGSPGNRFALSERSAEATTRAATAWLSQAAGRRWFAWVHYYDPHAPYSPPAEHVQSGPRGDYLGEVAYVDRWLDELVSVARSIAPDAIIVVTSDHGEGLGDHGEYDHGLLLYQSTLRVPLIVSAPGRVAAAGRSSKPVRTVDIAPTVLGLAGVRPPAMADGIDLRPLLAGQPLAIPPAYSETYFGSVTYGWSPLRALRSGGWKRVEGAHARLYDLGSDPAERSPLESPHGDVNDARLESQLARIPLEAPAATAGTDDHAPQVLARLRSLGYLGAGTSLDPARWDVQLDPEQLLHEHNAVLRAQESLDRGDLAMAEGRYRAILELSPGNRVAWLRLGTLLAARGASADATDALRRAVELDPRNAEAQYQLAQGLMSLRRFREAIGHWIEVTRLQPRRAAAWSNLGTSLLFDGQADAGVDALEEAVRISPGAGDLRENLARVQVRAGRFDDAIASLQEVARLQDDRFVLGALLAQLLATRGQAEAATTWLARARPGQESYAAAHLALGERLAGDRPEQARSHLREAIRVDPRLRDVIGANARLAELLAPARPQ